MTAMSIRVTAMVTPKLAGQMRKLLRASSHAFTANGCHDASCSICANCLNALPHSDDIRFFLEFLAYHFYWEALLVFAIGGFTDFFDGFVARRMNQQTALGAYLRSGGGQAAGDHLFHHARVDRRHTRLAHGDCRCARYLDRPGLRNYLCLGRRTAAGEAKSASANGARRLQLLTLAVALLMLHDPQTASVLGCSTCLSQRARLRRWYRGFNIFIAAWSGCKIGPRRSLPQVDTAIYKLVIKSSLLHCSNRLAPVGSLATGDCRHKADPQTGDFKGITKLVDLIHYFSFMQARSSVGERFLDTEEVGSSILPVPTIF